MMNPDTYFTGKPCKYGHIALRYKKSRSCIDCCAIRSKKQWQKIKADPVLLEEHRAEFRSDWQIKKQYGVDKKRTSNG